MAFEFRLPDIGEGIVEGEIITWHVQEGDVLKEDQPIVEIMTDKATIVIPSPKSGKVLKRFGEEGVVIKVGSVMVVIDADDGGAEISPKPPAAATQEPEPQRAKPPSPPPTAPAAKAAPTTAPPSAPAPSAGEKDRQALATPATRKLARELGVDISQVPPTGSQGRITKEDVQRFAQGEAPVLGLLGDQLLEEVLHLRVELVHADGSHHADGHGLFLGGDLDVAVVEFAVAESAAELLSRAVPLLGLVTVRIFQGRFRPCRQQGVEQPFFRHAFRFLADHLGLLLADHMHGQIEQVADHALDVAPVVADLRVLRGFHLEEGGVH